MIQAESSVTPGFEPEVHRGHLFQEPLDVVLRVTPREVSPNLLLNQTPTENGAVLPFWTDLTAGGAFLA